MTELPTTPQPASPSEGITLNTTDPVDWARRITDEFNAVGFTIEGMPEHLTQEQAISMLERVRTELAAHRAAQA